MKDSGYDITPEAVKQYQTIVSHASTEERKDIFFLRANDQLFHPEKNPVGGSLLTDIIDRDGKICKFTDVDLEDKNAYFVIAAPST